MEQKVTKYPEKSVAATDIPSPVKGATSYSYRRNETGGYNILMYDRAIPSVIDHKPNEQSAIRATIRWQKKENAAVAKVAKKGKL